LDLLLHFFDLVERPKKGHFPLLGKDLDNGKIKWKMGACFGIQENAGFHLFSPPQVNSLSKGGLEKTFHLEKNTSPQLPIQPFKKEQEKSVSKEHPKPSLEKILFTQE